MTVIKSQIVESINNILSNPTYYIPDRISENDITVSNKIVGDIIFEEPKLSRIIIDHYWPSINQMEVYHYTSHQAASSIVNSRVFRLTNISKNLKYNEIVDFCRLHNYDGYLSSYKQLLVEDLYIGCFTSTFLSPSQQRQVINAICGKVPSTRLKFRIRAKNPNFRRMNYIYQSSHVKDLLSEINQTLRVKFDRNLIFQGMSRLCAFNLDQGYKEEYEIRLLFKKFDTLGPTIQKSLHNYIEIPFRNPSETGYDIELLEMIRLR